MRISKAELDFFSQEINKVRNDSKKYLFGSRVDDSQRGGDIDILVLSTVKLNLTEKMRIKRNFCNHFGEQKIDLVSFSFNEENPFKELILAEPNIEF